MFKIYQNKQKYIYLKKNDKNDNDNDVNCKCNGSGSCDKVVVMIVRSVHHHLLGVDIGDRTCTRTVAKASMRYSPGVVVVVVVVVYHLFHPLRFEITIV